MHIPTCCRKIQYTQPTPAALPAFSIVISVSNPSYKEFPNSELRIFVAVCSFATATVSVRLPTLLTQLTQLTRAAWSLSGDFYNISSMQGDQHLKRQRSEPDVVAAGAGYVHIVGCCSCPQTHMQPVLRGCL